MSLGLGLDRYTRKMDTGWPISCISSRQVNDRLFNHPVHLSSSCGKEAFQLLVGGRSSPKAEARYDPARVDGGEQAKALVPSQAVGPSDVNLSDQPSFAPSLGIPNRHRGPVQDFVGTSPSAQKRRQMQSGVLDELQPKPHQPVELRAVGQGWKGVAQ